MTLVDLTHAIVLKEGNAFLVSEQAGGLPACGGRQNTERVSPASATVTSPATSRPTRDSAPAIGTRLNLGSPV